MKMLVSIIQKRLLAVSVIYLSLIPSQALAFEPLTLLTGIISPIVCKIIECKTETNKYRFVERPGENRTRLTDMRDKYKWERDYQEGD